MNDAGPGRIDAKWVLLGFLLLAGAAGTAVYFISKDTERRAAEAREIEAKLGRKVGPEDSPPKKPGLFRKSSSP